MWTREKEQRFQQLLAEREEQRTDQLASIIEFLEARLGERPTMNQVEVLVEDANELTALLEPFKR